MDSESKKEKDKPRSSKTKKKTDYRWVISVTAASFAITVVLSLLSGAINGLNLFIAVLILVFFVGIGIMADIVGVAIAAADAKPFHSMAARRIKSARFAILLIKNAERVSNVCNDVVGDIAGVVSGATGTAIAARIVMSQQFSFVSSLLITALIAALTVGGKAMGKGLALSRSNDIINAVSKIITFFVPGK